MAMKSPQLAAPSGLPAGETGLFCDLYELTMAQTYFRQNMFAPAVFSLFARSYPPNRGYLVSAGLEDVLDYLEQVRFGPEALVYLASTGMFDSAFLDYLSGFRFTGSVRAIPEGRIYFAGEPVLEVSGPVIESQLVETFAINQINLQTLLATKAARCVWAAQGRTVTDFGARRTQGTDAALKMSRCGYIAGFQSTSNVMAASRYGIPPAGTMAHSFISSFPSEIEAFRAYAATFPHRAVLLVDTYDTLEGAAKAATVAKEMEAQGHRLVALRLDSGDFEDLSRQVRRLLDANGLDYVKILVSGGLDEYSLESLVHSGAPIDIFGLGTKVGVSADAPWSDMAYKLVCYDGRPVMKLSPDKSYRPGAKQVFRFTDGDGFFSRDVIGLEEELPAAGDPLLEPVMNLGSRVGPSRTLEQAREWCNHDFGRLDSHFKVLGGAPRFPVDVSPSLDRLTQRVQNYIASAGP